MRQCVCRERSKVYLKALQVFFIRLLQNGQATFRQKVSCCIPSLGKLLTSVLTLRLYSLVFLQTYGVNKLPSNVELFKFILFELLLDYLGIFHVI